MAVLSTLEEYKAEYVHAARELSDAKNENQKLKNEFKRIDVAEKAAAEAAAKADALAAENTVLKADVARLTNALDSAQKAEQIAAGKAAKLDAIKAALA